MSQVMETNVPVAARALNAGGFQCLVEASRRAVIEYRPPRGLGKNGFWGRPAPKCLVARLWQCTSC